MANIPSIKQLFSDVSSDLINKLDLSDNDLKKVLNAFSAVMAGQFKLAYLFLGGIQDELFPDTANTASNGGTLDRQGLIYLNRIRTPETSGYFQLEITGEIGSTLRKDITFKSNDDSLNPSQIYILDQEKTITTVPDFIEVRSIKGGSDVLLEVEDTLTITEPVIGIEKIVKVNTIVSQPLSEESVADYRADIIQSRQLEPQGGSRTDYRLWASDAQGVRLVFPYVKELEAGTVQVYVEATTEDSEDGLGTPTEALLNSVKDVIYFNPDDTLSINERGRIPIQATLEVLPIFLNPVDIEINNLDTFTSEIKASIKSNIEIYLKEVRPFVSGADLARNKNDILYSAKLQSVVTDTITSSNFFTEFNVLVNGVSQVSFSFSRENIPYLRNLTINGV